MKHSIFAGKSLRTKIFTVITVVAVLVILGLNLLLTNLGLNKTVFLDLTPEELYTLSDKMVEQCQKISDVIPEDKKIKITFCADPDTLMDSTILRSTYIMAIKLSNKFDNIDVETVNVALNPTAVAKYKTTSLTKITPSDIIISYGDKYRIVGSQTFWTADENDALWSYNGEYRMASLMLSLTYLTRPVAYFVTGHGETYYDPDNPESEGSIESAYLADLLTERGLEIDTLDLSSVEAIPDDCALLIINNPTRDFEYDSDKLDQFAYVTDTEKIDKYLTAGNGSIMVSLSYDMRDYEGYEAAKNAGQLDSFKPMKVLKSFLREWGFVFSDTQVKDQGNSLDAAGEKIIGIYSTDENSYGNAIYGNYASSSSAPRVIFSNAGYIECAYAGGLSNSISEPGTRDVNRYYDSFLTSSSSSVGYAYDSVKDNYSLTDTDPSAKALAAVVARQQLDSHDDVVTYSYIFCVNSKDFFSNELLGNPSYANYDIASALVSNIVRTDAYASSELGGTSLNSPSFGGKILVSTALSETDYKIYSSDAMSVIGEKSGISGTAITLFSILIYAVPVALAAVGIIVCLKRKHL